MGCFRDSKKCCPRDGIVSNSTEITPEKCQNNLIVSSQSYHAEINLSTVKTFSSSLTESMNFNLLLKRRINNSCQFYFSVAGGELFDRVADEDLELTESDCVHFMRQICQGLQYMHLRSILHLDLKPENILCINKDNNLIKIIDFGLARRHLEGDSLRVMFGTPEFIAPEVVNYEEIGFPTDIWSVGVICYVL